jgi:hypothetical protein
MPKKSKAPTLDEILVNDDASVYLESLPDKERWPQYGVNGLPDDKNIPAPNAEAREALRSVWSQDK